MVQEAYRKLIKGLALIPPKYYLGAAGGVILLLSYGIGKTVVTPVTTAKAVKTDAVKPAGALLTAKEPAAVPPAIAEGNIFRKQRKEFTPPLPKAAAGPAEDLVPDLKLLGLIITDQKRLAIVDAEVKKYFKREVDYSLVLSGVKQAQLADDGHFYEVMALPGKGDKLASQTFNEGDIIADYRLDRVNETSIEVSSLANGKRTVIYLMEADEAAASLETRAKHIKAVPLRGPESQLHSSGATTP